MKLRTALLLALLPQVLQAAAGYLTPKDANGDGVIDSAEIQAAIGATRGVVFLPPDNTYRIDAPLLIENRHGVTLLGEMTRLPIVGDITAVVITRCNGTGLRNLAFVGTEAHRQTVVRFESTSATFATNVTFTNVGCAISIGRSIGPRLHQIAMAGISGAYGIEIGTPTHKIDAAQLHEIRGEGASPHTDWLLLGPAADGIELQTVTLQGGLRGVHVVGPVGPKYVYFSDVQIADTAAEGVLVEAGNDLLVHATTITRAGTHGFVLRPGYTGGAILTDLTITEAGQDGLRLEGSRDIGVLSSHFANNGRTMPSGGASGVMIGANAKFVSITRSTIVLDKGQTEAVRFEGTPAQARKQDIRVAAIETRSAEAKSPTSKKPKPTKR